MHKTVKLEYVNQATLIKLSDWLSAGNISLDLLAAFLIFAFVLFFSQQSVFSILRSCRSKK